MTRFREARLPFGLGYASSVVRALDIAVCLWSIVLGSRATALASDSPPRPIKFGETIQAMMPAGNPDTTRLWFEYRAEESARIAIESRSVDFDTELRVYRVSTDGKVEPLNEDDDGGIGTNSRLTIAAASGVTYRIAVFPNVDDWGGAVDIGVSDAAIHAQDWRVRRQMGETYWSDAEARARTSGNLAQLARAYNGHLRVFINRGARDEAKAVYERAAALAGDDSGRDALEQSKILLRVAWAADNFGKQDDADRFYGRAVALAESRVGSHDGWIADLIGNRARMLARKGAFAESKPLFERAAEIRGKQYSTASPEYAAALSGIAWAERGLRNFDKAEELYRRAVEITERALGAEHPQTADRLGSLAGMMEEKPDQQTANSLHARVLAIREQQYGASDPQYADQLTYLASTELQLGLIDQALAHCRQALEITEKALSSDDPQVADRLDDLAAVFEKHEAWSDAKSARERSASIRAEQYGQKSPEYAEAVERVGISDAYHHSYTEAEATLRRAVSITESSLGPNDPKVADRLEQLAWMFGEMGSWTRAKPVWDRIVAIREQQFGTNSRGHIDAVGHFADAAAAAHAIGDAEALYRRALSMAEASQGRDSLVVAERLDDLWQFLPARKRRSDGNEIIRLVDRAAQIREHAPDLKLAPMELITLTTYSSVSHVPSDLGLEGRFLRLLSLQEKALNPADPAIANTLTGLGAWYLSHGSLIKAKERFDRACAIHRADETFAPIGAAQGSALVAWDLGLTSEAISRFEDLVVLLRSRADVPADALPVTQLEFGVLLTETGDYVRAAQLLAEASEHFEKGGSKGRVGLVDRAVLSLLRKSGQAEKARELERRVEAEPFEMRVGMEVSGDTVYFDTSMWIALRTVPASFLEDPRAGVCEGARKLAAYLGDVHPFLIPVQADCAQTLWNTGNVTSALRTSQAAASLLNQHSSDVLPWLPEREALRFVESREPIESVLFSGLVQSPEKKRESWLEACWDWALGRRALVLDELAARHRDALQGESPEAQAAWQRLVDSRRQLASLFLQAMSGAKPGELAEAQRAKDDAERALIQVSAQYREEKRFRTAPLSDVAAALPVGSALVEYVRTTIRKPKTETGEPHYIALILPAAGAAPSFADLGPATAIDDSVEAWHERLRASWGSGATVDLDTVAAAGSKLRQLVWDPVQAKIPAARMVFIVPDGSLHRIQLAALPAPDGSYLVEHEPDFQLLSSGRDLVRFAPASAAIAHGRGVLVVGDPDYNARPDLPASESREAPTTFRGQHTECWMLGPPNWPRLPGSGQEAQAIASLFEGREPVAMLTGTAATEERFKREAPGKRIVHLATHGFFLDGEHCAPTVDSSRGMGKLISPDEPSKGSTLPPLPAHPLGPTQPAPLTAAAPSPTPTVPTSVHLAENPLVLSGLVLAGANHSQDEAAQGDDGILTAEEIAALDLRGVEIVGLSACDTGLGTIQSGEGVIGLERALEIAGVRSVLMSLWPVPDEAARQWMTSFYQSHLEGMSVVDSVRQTSVARLETLRREGKPTHPYAWAGFVAAGDWR